MGPRVSTLDGPGRVRAVQQTAQRTVSNHGFKWKLVNQRYLCDNSP